VVVVVAAEYAEDRCLGAGRGVGVDRLVEDMEGESDFGVDLL
jgi:hypothetical protein